jgi:hypothetical protein
MDMLDLWLVYVYVYTGHVFLNFNHFCTKHPYSLFLKN